MFIDAFNPSFGIGYGNPFNLSDNEKQKKKRKAIRIPITSYKAQPYVKDGKIVSLYGIRIYSKSLFAYIKMAKDKIEDLDRLFKLANDQERDVCVNAKIDKEHPEVLYDPRFSMFSKHAYTRMTKAKMKAYREKMEDDKDRVSTGVKRSWDQGKTSILLKLEKKGMTHDEIQKLMEKK